MKAIALVEEYVANAVRDVAERLNVGPSFMRGLIAKIINIAHSVMMMSSRLKLGLGLLALGAVSNNKAMRTEGRLELMTAALYFSYISNSVPQWLMMIVMAVLSFFFPWIMLIIFALAWVLAKFEIRKTADDPNALLKRLLLLRKYGLLDDEMTALLNDYEAALGAVLPVEETGVGSVDAGTDWTVDNIQNLLDAIRDKLAERDSEDSGPFNPGNPVPPAPTVASPQLPLLGVVMATSLVVLWLR